MARLIGEDSVYPCTKCNAQPWGQADRQQRSDFSKAVPCKKVSTILKLVAPQCWRQLTLAVRKVVEVNIREASLSDYKKIAEVHIESWCFTYRKILNIDFLSSFSLKRTSEYWKENITQGLFWIFVVESYHKDLIGYIQICKSKNLPNINRDTEIIAIYISPKVLRKRYGTNLFGYSLDFLKGNNFKEVFLWVFENNNVAINFYKKFGFANTDENRISDHNRESKFTEIKLSKSLR